MNRHHNDPPPQRPATAGPASAAAVCLAALLTAAIAAEAPSWTAIRGAAGDGVAAGADPPLTWSESSNIRWKTAVPQRGHSSPVVRDGRVYLATAIEENTREEKVGSNACFVADRITIKVLAYDFDDGRMIWERTLFRIEDPDPVHTLNSFATPTPVADGPHIFCDFGTFGTACLEGESGAVVWTTRLPLDHEVGPGSSPAVHKDLLILVRDGRDAQYVTALDTGTGSPRWKTPRPPMEGTRTDMHKAFSTPAFFEAGGRSRMIVPGAQWLVCYDTLTGAELWRSNHGKGFSIAPQAAVGNGMVVYCTGFSGNHLRAVRLGGSGDVTDSHLAWKSKRWTPTIPSPVLVGREIYWVSDTGTACCADATTGEMLWHQSLGGRFRASPIHAAGRLYLVDQDATCHVLKAGRGFELLKENRLDSQQVTATPAFVGHSIILRTHSHLYRIDKPLSSGPEDRPS